MRKFVRSGFAATTLLMTSLAAHAADMPVKAPVLKAPVAVVASADRTLRRRRRWLPFGGDHATVTSEITNGFNDLASSCAVLALRADA